MSGLLHTVGKGRRGFDCGTLSTILFSIFMIGCQEPPTTVSGSVTLDGKPLAIGRDMRGTVMFQPDHDGPVLNGNINADGTYRMSAGSSSEVVPGSYKVLVSAITISPPTENNPLPTSTRVTPARFASAAESDLRVEVVPGPNDIDLDLTSDANWETDGKQPLDGATDSADETTIDDQPPHRDESSL